MAAEAKKKDWLVFEEPLIKGKRNNRYKPDLIFVKGKVALVMDVTIRFESKIIPLADTALEEARKYE